MHIFDRSTRTGPDARRRTAFTLVELMMVVAIIALLIGITVPSLGKARIQAKRTRCMANLKQIGTGIVQYLSVHNDTYFFAAELPSLEAQVAQSEGREPYPPLWKALEAELGGESRVYQCPSDRNLLTPELGGSTYYETEKTSYEWRSQFNGAIVGRDDLTSVRGANLSAADAPMTYDFEAFHGGKEARQSVVTLYADFHVQADDWQPESD